MTGPTALLAAVASAEATLAAAGVPSARHDAEALAAHLLGVSRMRLTLLASPVLDEVAYAGLVRRRAAREPLQHLLGTAPFRHLELAVGPGVFVPRPETELVASAALAALALAKRRRKDAPPVAVDLCSGTGALALALATEAPRAVVHAVELDPVAFAWLRGNAAKHAPSVLLHHSDIGAPGLLAELDGTVDVVVSNPPYLRLDEAASLDPETAGHDPSLALFGGEDGLDVIRVVERVAARLLRPGGTVVVEHGDGQGAAAPAVFADAGGWREVADHVDLPGRDRFLTAVRARPPRAVRQTGTS